MVVAIDNAVKLVLESVEGLSTAAALTVLQRASDLLNACQQSRETGEPITAYIDAQVIESTAGLPIVVAALLEAEPNFLASAAVAQAALKSRLLDLPTPPVV